MCQSSICKLQPVGNKDELRNNNEETISNAQEKAQISYF